MAHFYQNLSNKVNSSNTGQPSPKERSGHCLVSNANYLYLFGGYNEPGIVYRDLWRYDTTIGLWEQMPDVENQAPECTVSSSMIIAQHNIFVFGGTSFPFSRENSNTLSLYDLQKRRWFNVSHMASPSFQEGKRAMKYPVGHTKTKGCGCQKIYDNPPTEKYGHNMVFSPDGRRKIHIFFGTVGTSFLAEQHSFDLKHFRWVEHKFCAQHCGRKTNGRYKGQTVIDDENDRVFLMGGSNTDTYFGFKHLDVYDTKQEQWQIVETKSNEFIQKPDDSTMNNNNNNNNNNKEMVFPCPRKAHSCVKHGDTVYLSGGIFTVFKQDGTKVDQIYNDVWQLDLKTNTWTKIMEVRINAIRAM